MKKLVKAIAALAVAATTLVGCGEGGKFVEGVSKDTIKIGAAIASEGAYASVGVPYGDEYKLYVDYINAHLDKYPELQGHKLQAIVYDDKGDGAAGAQYINQLIEDDDVFALVGILGTWNLVAAEETLKSCGVPQVYYGTGTSVQMFDGSADSPFATGNEKYMMGVQPLYKTEGRLMYLRCLTYAGFNDVKKIGVVYSTSDDGLSLKAGIEMQAALDTKTNTEIIYQQVSTTVSNEMTAQIKAVEDCDVIIAAGNQTYFKGIYDAVQTNEKAKGTPILTTYVNIAPTTVPDSAISAGASDIYGAAWVIIGYETGNESPEAARRVQDLQDFVDILTWAKDQGTINAQQFADYSINAYAMSSYIAIKMFLNGMKELKAKGYDITRANYLKAMEEAGSLPVAISGSVNYRPNGERIGLDSLSFVKYEKPASGSAQSGTFVQVDAMKSIDTLFAELK